MPFRKTGSPRPMNVIKTCCVCNRYASKIINGQPYCDKHFPQEQDTTNLNCSQISQMEKPLEANE